MERAPADRSAAKDASSERARRSRWLGLIHTMDDVQLVVLGDTRHQVQRSIADHIRDRAPDVLWPHDSARVCALASEGEFDAAIDLYFARVGERWDEERLTMLEVAV